MSSRGDVTIEFIGICGYVEPADGNRRCTEETPPIAMKSNVI